MGTHKKTRKFQVKKIIGQRDARLKKNQETGKSADSKQKKDDDVIREAWVMVGSLH
jgi:U3 small nucleolar RNA-associated protein 24